MDRRVHRHEVRVGRLEPADAGGAAMRRAVVQDPEGAAGVPVRGLGHDLGDEAVEGGDPGRGLAAGRRWPRCTSSAARQTQAPPACTRDPPGLPAPGPRARWDAGGAGPGCWFSRRRRPRSAPRGGPGPPARGRMDRGPARPSSRTRGRGEDPRAVLPRADGILVEPPPHGRAAQGGDRAAALGFAHDIRVARVGQRQAARGGQLTRDCLDLHHDNLWEETPGAGPTAGAPPAQATVGRRSACTRGLAISRPTESAAAIASLGQPSAASRIILVRSTSQNGNVYFRARLSRVSRSDGEGSMRYGLVLGMSPPPR